MDETDYDSAVMRHLIASLDAWGTALRAGEKWASWWWNAKNPAAALRSLGVSASVTEIMDNAELDAAGRMALMRCIRGLCTAGLLVPIRRNGHRITHLRPTSKGLAVAVALVRQEGGKPDLDAVLVALDAAEWATDELRAAVEAMKVPA